ncbi:MAG: nucleotidyltransferase family protein [Chloroflexi bacterium]|nr:nucleotidyltransferase family protein [Chloroflexota bacterium]
MTPPRFVGGRWADARQALLLQAALGPSPQAETAWQAWTKQVDLDDVDGRSMSILSHVYKNLQSHGYEDAETGRLKGIYRQNWYRNQLRLHNAADAVRALAAEGIDTLLLKGAALILLYYRDAALRPMSDVDLLVRTEDAARAHAVLERLGWHTYQRLRGDLAATFAVIHGVGYSAGPDKAIDLHSHALEECCYPGADDSFWKAARPLDLEGTTALTLCPEDLLLHVCIHGSRGAPARVLHWIPDALAIIRQDGATLDWDRLVAEARDRRLSLALGTSLRYLHLTFAAPIPEASIRALESTRHGWLERLDYRAQGGAPAAHWMAVRDLCRYLRQARGQRPWTQAWGFPGYLQRLWGLDHSWDLPREVLRRTRRRWRIMRRRRQPATTHPYHR